MAEPFEEAIARLFRAEFPQLFRYLDRSTGDPGLASDLAQEAFVRLFERGELPDEPTAWLVTVAHNLLRDESRRSGRRARLLLVSSDPVARGAADPDPDEALEKRERQAQVRTVLDELTERDRQALLLRHSGYSYREIAVALEIPATSVGTILLRAGARFRETFEERHGRPD